MTKLVAIDLGGTHVRFALAEVEKGRVVNCSDAVTLRTADYASLQTAWEAFAQQAGPLPRAAAIAVAAPISGEVLRLTNNAWTIRRALIHETLNVDRYTLINDFEAVGHAVALAHANAFVPLCGPDIGLPETGAISIVGPGTGLGVALLLRHAHGYHVQATEGGHVDFAPLDSIDDAILQRLRGRHRRVSVERIVSGPGLVEIYEALAAIEGRAVAQLDDKALWTLGLSGADSLAAAAIDRFCLALGSIAGDIALIHGSTGVVIAGGLGQRIRETLLHSGFAARFRAKGRYEALMTAIPVKIVTRDQPGLFGAAAAFVREHGD